MADYTKFLTPSVSELRIQASEQLSSYVDDFNALCHSKIPDWDAATQTWITRTTSNPASIFRYLLTSPHGLVRPYTTAKMDNASITALHAFCAANGYEFNFILDSEQTTWARLVQVLAAGRAAPTTDVDGLWGVVIDRSGKEVKQLFTPRNSWGMSVQRGFVDLPHALRVSFRDETKDFNEGEDYVFADGYSNDGANGTEKATDIIEWNFPGVTSWEKVWRMGRYFLAKMLHRQMAVTVNTDWEWLVCHRGDLVGIASDVLMNTFGTARIQRLVYDVDGVETMVGREEDIPLDEYGQPLIPIAVQLDDTVMFQEPAPARYGIAIRNRKGGVTSYELVPEYGDEEHSTLYFRSPIPAQAAPPLNGLCSVSLLGQEYEEYLLASVQPGDNASAELTLNALQEEAIAVLAAAGIAPDKANNAQMLAAILELIADATPGIATSLVNGICRPDGVTIKIDASGKISVVQAEKYDLAEFYLFRHPTLKSGFAPLQGGRISGLYQGKNITEYPIWAYLQTAEGQLLLKTEAEWQAMSTATWATLADGTKVGWNGIGGVPYYVQNLGNGTLRMPDVRGMYTEAAGFDSLGVGGVDGDKTRRTQAQWAAGWAQYFIPTYNASGAVYTQTTSANQAEPAGGVVTTQPFYVNFDNARVGPTGKANAPRRWGALACAYLGQPAS